MFHFETEFTRPGRATSADEICKIRGAAEVERMRARLSRDADGATLAAHIARRANEGVIIGKRQHPGIAAPMIVARKKTRT